MFNKSNDRTVEVDTIKDSVINQGDNPTFINGIPLEKHLAVVKEEKARTSKEVEKRFEDKIKTLQLEAKDAEYVGYKKGLQAKIDIFQNEFLPSIDTSESTTKDKAENFSEGEKILSKLIDKCREDIEHKPNIAIETLKNLKTEYWDKVSDYLKFRIVTNIGASYLTLGNQKEAINNFIEAEKYAPDSDKAISNMALVYYFQENWKETKKYCLKAMELNPDNIEAYSILIASYVFDKEIDKVENYVSEEKKKNNEIALSIGYFYLQRDNYDEAFKWSKLGYDSDENKSIRAKIIYSQSILASIFNNPSITFGQQIDDHTKELMKNAIEMLEDVWEQAKSSQTQDVFFSSAINLCSSYRLLGQKEKAAPILDELLLNHPDNSDIRRLAGQFHLEFGDIQEACVHLSKIPQGEDPKMDLLLVELYGSSSRFDLALKKLESIEIPKNDLEFESNAAALRLKLIFETEGEQKAFEKFEKLKKKYPKNISILLSASDIYKQLGNLDKAREQHGKFVLNFKELKFCRYFESFSSNQIQLWYFYLAASSFERHFLQLCF